jgi:hypothetical protein
MLSDDLFKHTLVEDQYHDYPIPTPCAIQKISTHEIVDSHFTVGKCYNMFVTLGVKFSSMPGYYTQAVKEAKQTLLGKIYGPILADLQEIRQAAYSGVPKSVIAICNKIENDILKGTDR